MWIFNRLSYLVICCHWQQLELMKHDILYSGRNACGRGFATTILCPAGDGNQAIIDKPLRLKFDREVDIYDVVGNRHGYSILRRRTVTGVGDVGLGCIGEFCVGGLDDHAIACLPVTGDGAIQGDEACLGQPLHVWRICWSMLRERRDLRVFSGPLRPRRICYTAARQRQAQDQDGADQKRISCTHRQLNSGVCSAGYYVTVTQSSAHPLSSNPGYSVIPPST